MCCVHWLTCGAAPLRTWYDLACKLHPHALVREPWFFRLSQHRVDALHYPGHVGCSEGYNPFVYRAFGSHSSSKASPYVNSQTAEQANARLAVIRNACGYMTQDHYLWFVRRYLGFFNRRKLASLQEQRQ